MMDNNLSTIIHQIEEILGPCYHEEAMPDDDIVELVPVSNGEIGIEISKDHKISIFAIFSYYDIPEKDISKGNYDIEELEADSRTFLLENSFKIFLSNHTQQYTVSQWDDGAYMCPGYAARVGFYCEEYTDKIVKEFIRIYQDFNSVYISISDRLLREYIIDEVLRKHGAYVEKDTSIHFCGATIQIVEKQLPPESNVDCAYKGSENCLFSAEGGEYAADVMPLRLFNEVVSLCELSDNLIYRLEQLPLLDSKKLYVYAPHLIFSTNVLQNEKQIYSHIEESNALLSLQSLLPFASEKFRDAYYNAYSGLFDLFSGKEPLIITEGSTDWKHMKKYWESFETNGPTIKFHEYEPLNSAENTENKLDMGSSALLSMCKAISKIGIGKPVIFIADRDEQRIIKEMSDNNTYKYWGNNVYSLVLPVPDHRISTPDVCIEHFYSDADIATYYICSDGIQRRLFIGRDFDEYGRNVQNGLLCIKRNLCGKNSMKIIDGSSDAKVISFSGDSRINFALSKQEFAEKSSIAYNSPAYFAFRKLADIVKEIIDATNN